MKDFQEYTTFITGAGSSIELDVEQAPLDEVADATIMQEATQQTTDRFGDEQIDYEIAGINASVQSPSWTHSLTHPKTEVITKLLFCDIRGAFGAIEG